MVGGIVREAGSTVKSKTGGWRSSRPIVDQPRCIKCRICERLCPEACITVGKETVVDYDFCKGCGICANECPVKCIKMIEEEK